MEQQEQRRADEAARQAEALKLAEAEPPAPKAAEPPPPPPPAVATAEAQRRLEAEQRRLEAEQKERDRQAADKAKAAVVPGEPEFSEPSFWDKVRDFAVAAGGRVIYAALLLYYAAQSDTVPTWARTVIYGALGYFIVPVDAIPDAVPVVGYSDDLGALVLAFALVAVHIDDPIRERAREKFREFFGRYPNEDDEPRSE
jgi:uncharacterized membrane protein YkvA (DUF1232 family)